MPSETTASTKNFWESCHPEGECFIYIGKRSYWGHPFSSAGLQRGSKPRVHLAKGFDPSACVQDTRNPQETILPGRGPVLGEYVSNSFSFILMRTRSW